MDLTAIDNLGLARVLGRGTGELVAQSEQAMLVFDRVSGACLLACEDAAEGAALLERHIDGSCRLLMVADHALGKAAFGRFGFSELLECRQAAYYGARPELSGLLRFRQAERSELPLLSERYTLLAEEELARIIERGGLLLGFDDETLVGFVGEHLEGSMGLLYVLPAFRRRGYGAVLERAMIARTMAEGKIPFGQVEKDNLASLALQRKLGLTVSERLICWMWK